MAGGRLEVAVDTQYPVDGRVTLTVTGAPDRETTVGLRIPSWCTGATLSLDGTPVRTGTGPGEQARVRAVFRTGAVIELQLPMPVRGVAADDRIDATRGQLALTRGPLVYCFEQVDALPGVEVDDLRLALTVEPGTDLAEPGPSAGPGGGVVADAVTSLEPDLLGGVVTVTVPVTTRGSTERTTALAVPYVVWANREVGPMRVWAPVADVAAVTS